MRFLLFSDIHADMKACRRIVDKSKNADLAIGAGDYALFRKGLGKTIDALSKITIPLILVHGNHESFQELTEACGKYKNIYVLHGNTVQIKGITFAGTGAGIPVTPFGSWSVDLSEKEALAFLPKVKGRFVFISHSPPYSFLDQNSGGQNLGSRSILNYTRRYNPLFVVCGHIHEHWNTCEVIDNIPVINAGPEGYYLDSDK